jgi:protein tyrosine/serine phosphatase
VSQRAPGLINFRDYGGYETAGGARVRPDRLYRCGHLAEINDDELEHVIGLDFAVIADLRYAGERETERSPWPAGYVERIIAHEGHRTAEAPHMALFEAGAKGVAAVDDFYAQFYAELPFDPLYQPLFARTLVKIAAADGRSLIHCAAGKDRTGIQAALILHALDVPRATIVADYLRSSKAPGLVALKPRIIGRFEQRFGLALSDEAADALLDVKPAYIETAFTAIEARYGSLDAYLDASGADQAVRASLRERLVVRS